MAGVVFTVTVNILRNTYAPVFTNLPSNPSPIVLNANDLAGQFVFQVAGSDNDTVVCISSFKFIFKIKISYHKSTDTFIPWL